ncbi:MAG: XdhC family protein, partial [Myxococcales bacterium]|nr:XdhC family protein [Myxococcales bacterium]
LGGTVGGGGIELQTLIAAGEAIEEGKSRLVTAKLTEKEAGGIGMMCGGSVDVFVHVYVPEPRLLLCGAGHINKCLAPLALGLGFRVTVVDDRAEWANEAAYPGARVVVARPEDAMASLGVDRRTYVVVATRDRDTAAIIAASKTDAPYIGVVASKRKAIQIGKHLADSGEVDLEALLPRFHAPIGLDLGGRTPEAVALTRALALVSPSRAIRLLGNAALSLFRGTYPTRIFSDEGLALAWLEEHR